MHRQKKTALGVTGLTLLFILLAAGLRAAGCEQTASTDTESRGEDGTAVQPVNGAVKEN